VKGGEGVQNYMKLVAHKITRNNTTNKVLLAPTELLQLLSQNTKHLWRGNCTKVAVRLCAVLSEKMLEVEETRAPVPHSWRRQ